MLTRMPRKGDKIGGPHFKGPYTVTETPKKGDTLCWIVDPSKPLKEGFNPCPFIWYFPSEDKLNQLAEIVEPGPEYLQIQAAENCPNNVYKWHRDDGVCKTCNLLLKEAQ